MPAGLLGRGIATLALAACTATAPASTGPDPRPAPVSPSIQAERGLAASEVPGTRAPDAGTIEEIDAARADAILFGDPAGDPSRDAACPRSADRAERVRCLTALRYETDPAAAKLALELFASSGDVVGTHPDAMMDGGFRGNIHLLPALATGRERRHLGWITAAARDHGDFLAALSAAAKAPLRYRVNALAFRVFRSERRTTPSAYADGWTVSYNVAGSLNTSEDAVRETLFHEIFHLNDAAHGWWSRSALGPIFDGVVARCGASTPCLRPYAPNSTLVRGGTYYAFQPGNGVVEYAAELAIRYYRETRAALARARTREVPFKCGVEEDARAWSALVNEFFGGVDLSGDCPVR